VKRRRLAVTAPGRPEFVDDVLPEPPDGSLLLRTEATGLSAGTELAFVKGEHPALHSAMDTELGLFRPGTAGSGYPVLRLGYMEVARVLLSRTPAFAEGELVATAYGHATAHVSDPLREHVVPLPSDFDPLLGVFVAHFGPICANGLLHAAADATGGAVSGLGDGVSGRRVAVVGGGPIGLLTGLFAAAHGAAEVVVIDADGRRRGAAEELGLGSLPLDGDPGRTLKVRWRHGPADHGADVVFQCRGRAAALALALRLLRPQSTVIDLAFYADGADAVRLGEEFHHNGLGVRCAQIGRVPRALRGTWDRDRLSAVTLDLLAARGADIVEHLVTDRVPLADAPEHLAALADGRRHAGLQTVYTA
jgi:threonine dehydrogenase-like Zn-dependent dehydrogenase